MSQIDRVLRSNLRLRHLQLLVALDRFRQLGRAADFLALMGTPDETTEWPTCGNRPLKNTTYRWGDLQVLVLNEIDKEYEYGFSFPENEVAGWLIDPTLDGEPGPPLRSEQRATIAELGLVGGQVPDSTPGDGRRSATVTIPVRSKAGDSDRVFLPDGVRARLDLFGAPGGFRVGRFDPMTGVLVEAAPVEGGEARWFVSPFAYQAALFLKRIN